MTAAKLGISKELRNMLATYMTGIGGFAYHTHTMLCHILEEVDRSTAVSDLRISLSVLRDTKDTLVAANINRAAEGREALKQPPDYWQILNKLDAALRYFEQVPQVIDTAHTGTTRAYPPTQDSSSGGAKYDQDKPRMELLDSYWLEQVALVLSFGAKKYSAHNWRKGLSSSRLLGAALRHIMSYLSGQKLDPETGLSHLAHASCCLMFAVWMAQFKPELTDHWYLDSSKEKEDNK